MGSNVQSAMQLFPIVKIMLQHTADYLITSTSVDFMQVCLVGKFYSEATRFLDAGRHHRIQNVRHVDILRFFYYGGRAYATMKKYEQAMECFITVSCLFF